MSKAILEKLDKMDGKLEAILNKQTEMQTTLYGAKHEKNGGLCSKVEKNSKAITDMRLTMAGIGAAAGGLITLVFTALQKLTDW